MAHDMHYQRSKSKLLLSLSAQTFMTVFRYSFRTRYICWPKEYIITIDGQRSKVKQWMFNLDTLFVGIISNEYKYQLSSKLMLKVMFLTTYDKLKNLIPSWTFKIKSADVQWLLICLLRCKYLLLLVHWSHIEQRIFPNNKWLGPSLTLHCTNRCVNHY